MTDGWVPCIIDGCKRRMGVATYRKRWGEPGSWICPHHWGRATKAEKRVIARIKRLERKFGWEAVAWRSKRIWDAVLRRVAD